MPNYNPGVLGGVSRDNYTHAVVPDSAAMSASYQVINCSVIDGNLRTSIPPRIAIMLLHISACSKASQVKYLPLLSGSVYPMGSFPISIDVFV